MSKLPRNLPPVAQVKAWARDARPESLDLWREIWEVRADQLTRTAERTDQSSAWRRAEHAVRLAEVCARFA